MYTVIKLSDEFVKWLFYLKNGTSFTIKGTLGIHIFAINCNRCDLSNTFLRQFITLF